jgi:hypothetical protein
MRKFKALLLAVMFLFASATLSYAQVQSSEVNYNNSNITFLGAGGLDLVGGATGALGGAALGALGGAALGGLGLGGLGLALTARTTVLGDALTWAAIGRIVQPGIIGGVLGGIGGGLFTAITGVIPGSRLLGGVAGWGLGHLVDLAVLRPELTSGIISVPTLGGVLGALAGGGLSRVAKIGVGALAGAAIGSSFELLGTLGGGALGAIFGLIRPGILPMVITGLAGGVGVLGGGLVGGGVGLVGGFASGFGLGNTADEFIQAGLTRGDSAPSKPAASVADFM